MGNIDDLYISVPSFFRCPISLDVMKSPVSLCTGVTYDRTSIQRWLDSGNNTCPATMQVLQTKDFVPNYTLQRLIQIWSNNNNHNHNHNQTQFSLSSKQFHSLSSSFISDLIQRLIENEKEMHQNESFLFESFVKILCFASERPDNRRFLACNGDFVGYLTRIVCSSQDGPGCVNPDLLEAGLKLLHLVISSDVDDRKNDKKQRKLIGSCDLIGPLTRILQTGRPGTRFAAAGIIEIFSRDFESNKIVFDRLQELIYELLHVLKQGMKVVSDEDETRAVLSCLISLCSTRTSKKKLVRAGGVKIIGEKMISLSSPSNEKSNKHVIIHELLLTLLEMLAGLTEGRTAISDEQYLVPVIINKLMKVSKVANEHGISLLWSLCYLFRDQRAKDAVMRSNGGLTKILLLMQSDCSPSVKKMCCDLLRIFRVNSKSCLSSYDTKTTHIMPC